MALHFNLETIVSRSFDRGTTGRKGGNLTQRYNKTVSIYMEICLYVFFYGTSCVFAFFCVIVGVSVDVDFLYISLVKSVSVGPFQ